jgi:hypothetical protein
MKRGREDGSEVPGKSALREEYGAYLQSDRTDKEALLGAKSPNRLKNVTEIG